MRHGTLTLLITTLFALSGCPTEDPDPGGDVQSDTSQTGADTAIDATWGPQDAGADALDSGVDPATLTGCDRYCALAATLCGDLYASDSTCASACSDLATDGADGDLAGDSLACRQTYLDQVEADPATGALFCPNVAAVGSPSCGTATPSCETYCALVTTACTGDQGQYLAPPNDLFNCTQTCERWPLGDLATPTGHTVACRQLEASTALGGPVAAAGHCDAAGPSGGDVCGTPCEAYCDLALSICDAETLGEALFADLVGRMENYIDCDERAKTRF
ncbi:MAG: hypothetical protein QF464_07280, partial [Myxococcota bacterium]|nr:hypothetical protein [Myxococcota bacterium]